jgi:hypothetical protein
MQSKYLKLFPYFRMNQKPCRYDPDPGPLPVFPLQDFHQVLKLSTMAGSPHGGYG